MKSTISFFLLIICTVVLAAQQSQAKKGCSAYGHACYGGHGKRSLGSLVGGGNGNGNGNGGNGNGNGAGVAAAEQDDVVVRPDAILQLFPNEAAAVLTDGDLDAFPKYRLIKIMKSWFSGHGRRPSDRISEIDYPISAETFNRDRESSNIFN